jgi:lysophospholipase L1-like esterase
VSALASRAGSWFRVEAVAPSAPRPAAQTLDLFFARQARGGRFAVEIDGREIWRLDTDAGGLEAGRERLVLPADARAITLRALDDAGVEVHGLALERDVPGVVIDTVGINGARATDASLWDWRRLASFELAARRPDLVVFAYGSNEVDDDPFDPVAYRERLFELVTDARRVSDPPPDCLLLGPPDRQKRNGGGAYLSVDERLEAIVAAQRATADECGCAFFDTREAMGGPGAMARFATAEPPLAQSDRVHLTRAGYKWLADTLAGSLLAGYQAWLSGRKG